MNSVWFEDFVTLAESAGFSRAAELRFISQPSLSRRIQSLEEWIGVVLIDRRTHTFRLTPAGEVFLPLAVDLLRQINHARTMAQDAGGTSEQKLRFAATHVLSMTFFPQWLRSLERDEPLSATIELTADHMVACEALMMDGRAQFLICHNHPEMPTDLQKSFRSHLIGSDTLIPVAAPEMIARFAADEMPLLSFTSQSGMGRILTRATSAQADMPNPVIFASHLSNVLTTMARNGRGAAWCPESQIAEDLAKGRLRRVASLGDPIPVEIRIWRPKARLSTSAEDLWSRVRSEQAA